MRSILLTSIVLLMLPGCQATTSPQSTWADQQAQSAAADRAWHAEQQEEINAVLAARKAGTIEAKEAVLLKHPRGRHTASLRTEVELQRDEQQRLETASRNAEEKRRQARDEIERIRQSPTMRAWAAFVETHDFIPAVRTEVDDIAKPALWSLYDQQASMIHDEKVRGLVMQMRDKDPVKRGGAAVALGRLGDNAREALPFLEVVLLLDHSALQWSVAAAIKGTPTSPSLEAATAMAAIGGKGIDLLLEWLEPPTPRPSVSKSCAKALGRVKDDRIVPALLRSAVRDQKLHFGWQVPWIESLGEQRAKQAVPVILDLFERACATPDNHILEACADAFVKIGDTEVVPTIVRLAKLNPRYVARDKPADLASKSESNEYKGGWVHTWESTAARIITRLGEIKDKRATDLLIDLSYFEQINIPDVVRKAALRALGNIGDDRAVPALLDALYARGHVSKRHLDERILAAETLGKFLSDQRTLAALKDVALNESTPKELREICRQLTNPRAE